jgi:hypothetical protein
MVVLMGGRDHFIATRNEARQLRFALPHSWVNRSERRAERADAEPAYDGSPACSRPKQDDNPPPLQKSNADGYAWMFAGTLGLVVDARQVRVEISGRRFFTEGPPPYEPAK